MTSPVVPCSVETDALLVCPIVTAPDAGVRSVVTYPLVLDCIVVATLMVDLLLDAEPLLNWCVVASDVVLSSVIGLTVVVGFVVRPTEVLCSVVTEPVLVCSVVASLFVVVVCSVVINATVGCFGVVSSRVVLPAVGENLPVGCSDAVALVDPPRSVVGITTEATSVVIATALIGSIVNGAPVVCSGVAAPDVYSVITEPMGVANFVVVTSTVVLSSVDEKPLIV